MPRRNDKTTPKPRARTRPLASKKTVPWKKAAGGKRPKPPADEEVVSRISRVRSTGRGGRGR